MNSDRVDKSLTPRSLTPNGTPVARREIAVLARANPQDIFVLVQGIKGLGFTALSFYNYPANPKWIKEQWRTKTGVVCQQCGGGIQALLKSHRTGKHTFTDRPFIFCNCVRLQPSSLPSLEFFTANWAVVIDLYNSFLAVAKERQAELHSVLRRGFGID
jgi:hypothetical protein